MTDSGERYVFRDGSNSTSTSFEGQQGAATFTANIRLRLDHVGPGEGDDLVFHQVAHVTTSPDGEQVVSFSRSQGSVCV